MQDFTLQEALTKARFENNPNEFMKLLSETPENKVFSAQFASDLDNIESLPMKNLFELGPITPMAGHSLGPIFKPARERINQVFELQKEKLHEGHFPDTREEGGDWYRCDREPKAIDAMRSMFGNFENGELVFTQKGLSDLLGEVISTFYEPGPDDWLHGKTSICYLGKEFLSDQKIIETTLKRGINTARRYHTFKEIPEPSARDLMLGILPNEDGLYKEKDIIDFVKENAHKIQILHLSHIVFSTGQRLDLHKILSTLEDVIATHKITVGVDLAHTTGNRPLDLPSLNLTYAAGCSYKFACGSAGAGGFLYVSNKANLEEHQPIQGWVAVENPANAFKFIDGEKHNTEEPIKMCNKGAIAFTRSNPSPIAIAALQEFAKYMHTVGWDKLVAKSECLTRYMIALLKHQLDEKIHFITPEEPEKRGSMIVFQIQGLLDVKPIEDLLKQDSPFGKMDIDTRPPKNIRITAHCYTEFMDIYNTVSKLTLAVKKQLVNETSFVLKDASNFTLFSPEIESNPRNKTQQIQQII